MKTNSKGSTAKKSARRSSVEVSANELQNIVNSAVLVADVPTSAPSSENIGLSVGVGHASVGSPSSPSRPGRGRSDSASQLDNSVIMENERTESAKGALRSFLSSYFSAPVFDKDTFAAELLKSGKYSFTEIVAKVNEGRKAWEKEHVAPTCTYQSVCELIRTNSVAGRLWPDYCPLMSVDKVGVSPSLPVVWSWTGNDNDMPTSTPLADDATNSDIITALLSLEEYAKGMHAYNLRKSTAVADACRLIRRAVRLLSSADVVSEDIKGELSNIVDVVMDEQKRINERIAVLTNEIAEKEMEIALGGLLRRSADIRLRSFRGGLSDYELSLVGLRGWSEGRYNNLMKSNTSSIKQKREEIAELTAKLTA